jgi:hypothetical protein
MNQLSIVLNKHIIKDTWATSSRMTCSSLRMSVFFHKKKKKSVSRFIIIAFYMTNPQFL